MNKPTSFRLTEDNFAKLKALAKRKELNLSQMVNRLISSYSTSEESHQENNSSNTGIGKLIEEIRSQKQRTNILQNQIDFLIKRNKNAKSRN